MRMEGRLLCLLVLKLLALVVSGSASSNSAQGQGVSNPFQSQGVPPKEFSPIYVSFYLDRLIAVDDHQYIFEAVTYVRFSWIDTRAAALLYPIDPNNTAACTRSCQNLVPTSGAVEAVCCDRIWLPGTNFRNAFLFPDGRTESEIVSLGGVNNSAVQWLKVLHGVYYTPMSFRNFPFDRQSLVLSLEAIDHAAPYIASSIGSKVGEDVIQRRGNDLSSWRVQRVSTVQYNRSLTVTLQYGTFSNAADPLPLKPEHEALTFTYPNFVITIDVVRLSSYYVYNIILPMSICVALSWITFLLSAAEHVDTRLQIVVTLFLALTAMQFVVNDQLPKSSYITALHIQVVISYAAISVVGLEGLAVYYLTRKDIKKRKNNAQAIAAEMSWRTFAKKFLVNPATGAAANAAKSIGIFWLNTSSATSRKARQLSDRLSFRHGSETNCASGTTASTSSDLVICKRPAASTEAAEAHKWRTHSPLHSRDSQGWPGITAVLAASADSHKPHLQQQQHEHQLFRTRHRPAIEGEDQMAFEIESTHDDDRNNSHNMAAMPKNFSSTSLCSSHPLVAGMNHCDDDVENPRSPHPPYQHATHTSKHKKHRGWLARMRRIRALVHEDFDSALETVHQLDVISLLILPVLYIAATILTFTLDHERASYSD
eukprot:jgi/Chlat1/1687/Chrsp127S01916